MPDYKIVDSEVLDSNLKQIADAIREKGNTTNSLSFPIGMINAIINIETGNGSSTGDCEKYTGEYVVTPKTTEQVMPTSNKHMTDDVTIKKIPYFEASNLSGGDTVYIGTEVT